MDDPKRHYKGKDVEMLTVIDVIVENAILDKDILQPKRSNWADPYFENVKGRIDTATQTYLGVDSAKDLRQSTQAINGIQSEALPLLAEFKVQVEEDYKKDISRRNEILKQLGFTDFHRAAQRKDQEALVSLLFKFKQNMTGDLSDEITAKGTLLTTITTITGFADSMKNANVSQETVKAGRKTITAAAINAFNDIYDEVISITRLAAKFTKDQPDIQAKFSYNGILKNLNKHKAASQPEVSKAAA